MRPPQPLPSQPADVHQNRSRRPSNVRGASGSLPNNTNSKRSHVNKSGLQQIKTFFHRSPRPESPDIILPPSSRFNRETLITFCDCSISPKRFFAIGSSHANANSSPTSTSLACLGLIVGFSLFIAFLIWIIVFMRMSGSVKDQLVNPAVNKVFLPSAAATKEENRRILAELFNRNYYELEDPFEN